MTAAESELLRDRVRPPGDGRGLATRKIVVALSGSPAPTSRTSSLAEHALAMLASEDVAVENIRLSSLNADAILFGKYNDLGVRSLTEKVSAAHGVIVATPIFKAAYSGMIKAALDVLPQFALAGKVVLPIATGGTVAHALALDYALRPVLQSMGARHIVQSCLVCDPDISVSDGVVALSPSAEAMLTAALANFGHSLSALDEVKKLGHPRPHEG